MTHGVTPTCRDVRDVLGEFALGILGGRERSRVLAHVGGCDACRAELESLVTAADALFDAGPTSEPPVGFEVRLTQRLHAESRRRRARRPLRGAALVAAALVLLVAGFAVGHAQGNRANSSATSTHAPLSADLLSSGHVLGHVWLSPGPPSWIYMNIDDPNWTGTIWCQVTLANGRALEVGAFSLAHGYGAWAAKFDAAGSPVTSARVRDAKGTVLASARLAA